MKSKIIIIAAAAIIFVGLVLALMSKYIWTPSEEEQRQMEYETRTGIDEYGGALAELHPLTTKLPYKTPEFEVHYGVDEIGTYKVFYEVVVIRPKGVSEIEADRVAAERVSAAESWLVGQGADLDTISVNWVTE